MGKTSKRGTKNIKFACSEKSRRFECGKLKGKTVEDVGGIYCVLGERLRKSGTKSAKDLTCKMKGMTKRNYLRFIMNETCCNVRLAMDSYVSLKSHCVQMGDCNCKSKSSKKSKRSKRSKKSKRSNRGGRVRKIRRRRRN